MASSLSFHPTMAPLPHTSLLNIRSSKAEGPLRRPATPVKEATPPLSRPSPPAIDPSSSSSSSSSLPISQSPASPQRSPSQSLSSSSPAPPLPRPASSFVTVEYQRQRAKELQEYFLDRKYEEQSREGRIFGWTFKNEINNGRWAMFGIAVGLLTEYATGSDFVDQMRIIISNLGIADLE